MLHWTRRPNLINHDRSRLGVVPFGVNLPRRPRNCLRQRKTQESDLRSKINVRVVSHRNTTRARFARGSFYTPLVRWRRQLRRRGVELHWTLPTRLANRPFDHVLLDQRAFADLNADQLLDTLAEIRKTTPSLVWMDTSDSTGTTRFEVLQLVDRYVKRHLLRDPTFYQQESGFARYHESKLAKQLLDMEVPFDAPPSSPSRALLADKDFDRIALSWTFRYVDMAAFSRYAQGIAALRGGYTNHRTEWPIAKYPVAALFTSGHGGPIGVTRKLAHETAMEQGWVTLDRPLSGARYLDLLGSCQAVLSPFGLGEMCIRDFEAAWVGRALLKPSVEHLVTFPQILAPAGTYHPLSWNPRSWPSEVHDLDAEYVGDIAAALREMGGTLDTPDEVDRFVEHFLDCVLEGTWCEQCPKGWWNSGLGQDSARPST